MDMDILHWRSMDAINLAKLANARHQVHSAVQWLARMACSYRSPEPDDRNLALPWDSGRNAIATQELSGQLGMELRLPELILQFTENGVPVRHEFDTEGHTPAHVEAWILVELLHRNIDRDKFSKLLPYDVTALMTGDAVEFAPETCREELDVLASWYGTAAAVIGEACSGMARDKPRIWPHDLSLEVLVPFMDVDPAGERAVRVGFFPGAGLSSEPGFYVARQKREAAGMRPPDAVLTLRELQSDRAETETILGFLRRSIAAARTQTAS